jgi:hypothetical protein
VRYRRPRGSFRWGGASPCGSVNGESGEKPSAGPALNNVSDARLSAAPAFDNVSVMRLSAVPDTMLGVRSAAGSASERGSGIGCAVVSRSTHGSLRPHEHRRQRVRQLRRWMGAMGTGGSGLGWVCMGSAYLANDYLSSSNLTTD